VNAYTSVRVGSRQWAMLRAADDAFPGSVSGAALSRAVGDGMPPSFHRPIIESLIEHRLLSHECEPGNHPPTRTCQLRITERGAWARLDTRGRAAAQR
jgi:hypothetical protein